MRTTTKQGADTLHLCKAYSGGTFWTNGQCSQRKALIERIVTVSDGMPFEQQVDLAKQSQIDNYDAMARQPQSGQMQDWISVQKKKARDKWFRMGC